MEDGLLSIILFAVVAAFLVFRLRSALGKRTGYEQQRHDPRLSSDTTEQSPAENVLQMPQQRDVPEAEPSPPDSPLAAGITQIKVHDPSFDQNGFLGGARAAFEMVLTAFARGDRETLSPLLSDEVYENFERSIEQREQQGEERQTTLVGIRSAELIEADMEGSDAVVTVKFVSDQIDVTRDRNGAVVDGDPEKMISVTDIWTFQRDTRSRDPNWSLVATRSPN